LRRRAHPRPRRQEPAQHALQVPHHRPLPAGEEGGVSDGARTWGLRLLALAISAAVWYSVSLSGRENQSEISVDQALVSYSLPRGVVAIDPVRTARVRLRGPGKKIRGLNPSLVK